MTREDLIQASIRLAKAVLEDRHMARMMCECPPDDIDKALDKWFDVYERFRNESWNKKDLPEFK